jgi:signal transduction histidine kinase
MTLRTKLLAAQAPHVLAIVVLAGAASSWITTIAAKTDRILRENYRSVLAAQRMKEAVERIDSAATFWILGRRDLARTQIAANAPRFDSELVVEEHNITEPGEGEAAERLRATWTSYLQKVRAFQERPDAELTQVYFDELAPAFRAVHDGADEVLAINQDAMVHKSDQALESAAWARNAILFVGVLALGAGLVVSVLLTTRILRPLAVLGQAVRRVGEGDLIARAQLGGADEISKLAQDFNTMADHLEQYRKSSLGELLVAQSAAQAVIDSLPDPVVVMAVNGTLLNANKATERVLGVGVESARGLGGADPAARAVVERMVAHVLAGNGPYVPKSLEEAIPVHGSEGDVHLLPRATPIYSDEGVIDGATVVLQDVSRLLRFDELKNNLVATVAHEFRTPLTSLRMAIHMCVEGAAGELGERQKDLLLVAREDCERLQTIVEELLDLSRIQAGRIDVDRRRTSAETLVQAAVDAQQAAAKLATLTLRSETVPGLGEVEADGDRIQLVFDNLITNALRHTTAGEVVVRALPADGAVRFEVSDSGAGIAAEHQSSIFEKFYRVPGAPEGGAGLGLFIAKEIITAHGGQIGFTSDVGKGTTFWFTLPVAPEASA